MVRISGITRCVLQNLDVTPDVGGTPQTAKRNAEAQKIVAAKTDFQEHDTCRLTAATQARFPRAVIRKRAEARQG
jgi:hypothetical protein